MTRKREEKMRLQVFWGYSWMRGDNESLHHGVSHKHKRPDFLKNKLDHQKKYEDQEKVGRGRKNEVNINETRN